MNIRFLYILFALSVFGLFSGSQEPVVPFLRDTGLEPVLRSLHTGNSILFNLSGGFIISIFFWYLVVYMPENKHRKIIKANLANRYASFKEDTIQILLWASIGTHDSELPKELCDYRKFKAFFSENRNERWDAALNGLQYDQARLNDLLIEMELLYNEVSYVLNNVKFEDHIIHSFFKRLSENIYRLKNCNACTYDHVKYLGNFLYAILAQWSFISGQQEEDVIQVMIDRI